MKEIKSLNLTCFGQDQRNKACVTVLALHSVDLGAKDQIRVSTYKASAFQKAL